MLALDLTMLHVMLNKPSLTGAGLAVAGVVGGFIVAHLVRVRREAGAGSSPIAWASETEAPSRTS
jgi:hypothetical protein